MTSTDVAVIGGGMGLLHTVEDLSKAGVKTTACMGTPFIEFIMASCPFLVDPNKHSAWYSEPESFKLPGVDYVFDAVTEINPHTKTISFAKSPPLTYKAVIVATGLRFPLISPVPGTTLARRKEEVRELFTRRLF
jgi:NADH dehydrogenase FAD-containing subunit